MKSLVKTLILFPLLLNCGVSSAMDYFPILNVNANMAQKLALEMGGTVGLNRDHTLALSWEPGLSGEKYHVGYQYLMGSGFDSTFFLRTSWVELSQTEESNGFHANSRYQGIEFELIETLKVLKLSLMRNKDNGETALAAGIGFGM